MSMVETMARRLNNCAEDVRNAPDRETRMRAYARLSNARASFREWMRGYIEEDGSLDWLATVLARGAER